jgi:hypothetical protein
MQDLHSENHTTGPAARGNAPHLPAAPLPEKARLQGSIITGGEAAHLHLPFTISHGPHHQQSADSGKRPADSLPPDTFLIRISKHFLIVTILISKYNRSRERRCSHERTDFIRVAESAS